MVISTTRFGQVQISQEDIINFTEGLLGFSERKKFVLLDDPSDDIFAWLQSCDSPGVAFPILEPEIFHSDYNITLTKSEMDIIKLSPGQKPRVFSIITIPDDPTQMTANLKAPIVINTKNKIARQCVLQDNNLAIREPIFSKLQQRVVQNPSISIKSQNHVKDLGVIIKPLANLNSDEASR